MTSVQKLSGVGLAAVACILSAVFLTREKDPVAESVRPEVLQSPSAQSAVAKNNDLKNLLLKDPLPGQEGAKVQGLFSNHYPLSAEERLVFDKKVRDQIRRSLQWGKLSEEEMDELRKTLFQYADRGVADETWKLDALHVGKALSEAESGDAILGMDTLQTLAKYGHPVSREALLHLASRAVERNEAGKIKDPVASTITFEALDGVASIDPDQARQIVMLQEDNASRIPYVYHWIIGRKLAGVDETEAVAEARSHFGDEIVGKIGIW